MSESESKKLKVVLCWHMHQPWYRETLDGVYRLPWVYLHALKDYSDMAAHLERHPQMKAVVNFTPVLLEQLDSYAQELSRALSDGTPTNDPLINLLVGLTPIPEGEAERVGIVRDCTRAHAPEMIDPYPAFVRLLAPFRQSAEQDSDGFVRYLNDQYFVDLLMWYHMAWFGYDLQTREDVKAWMAQGEQFSGEQRRELLTLMAEVLSSVITRYKALANSGQVELSMTPYSHPIMPLLLDFDSLRCAMPNAPKPSYDAYPDGEARAHWHMQHGMDVFERFFGRRAEGVWLSEGSVSDEAVGLLPEYGVRWTASGEGVWHNSSALSELEHSSPESRSRLFSPHVTPKSSTALFFRDDGLSDKIGFDYQSWHADDAVGDFLHHLHNISSSLGESVEDHVVSIILDGENAWEYYPNNAHHFLDALYRRLVEDERVEVSTFSGALDSSKASDLPALCAGSWVYGSFSTWIGEPDKNRGWDRLVEAKMCYDDVMAGDSLSDEERDTASLQLAVCEGSDWFWWFGDYNPGDSVRDFDELYRQQLTSLYEMMKCPVPDNLSEPLSAGSGQMENSGTMRRGADF